MEYRLLIIDDEEALSRVAARMSKVIFTVAGLQVTVTCVYNGEQAREALATPAGFTHILCDVEFPGGTSIEMHDLVRWSETRFVAYSGNHSHEHLTTLKERGVRVVHKPFGRDDLAVAFGLT